MLSISRGRFTNKHAQLNKQTMRFFFLLLVVIGCSMTAWAQNQVLIEQFAQELQQAGEGQRSALMLKHIRQLHTTQQAADLSYYLKRVDRAVEVTPSLKPFLKEGKGLLCLLQNDQGGAFKLLEEAINGYQELSDRVGIARCQQHQALIGLIEGNPARAIELLNRSGRVLMAAGEKELVAGHYALLGNAYQVQDITTKALDNYQAALSEYESHGNDKKVFEMAEQCAQISFKAGFYEETIRFAELMTQTASLSGAGLDAGLGQLLIAKAQGELGQTGQAIEAALAGLQYDDKQSNNVTKALLHAEIAHTQYRARQIREAQSHLRSALVLLEAAPNDRMTVEAADVVAAMAYKQNDAVMAVPLLLLANQKHDALLVSALAESKNALKAQSDFLASMKSEEHLTSAQQSVQKAHSARNLAFGFVTLLLAACGFLFFKRKQSVERSRVIEKELNLTLALCREQEVMLMTQMNQQNQEIKQLNQKLSYSHMQLTENEKIIAEQKSIIQDRNALVE
jgi:tetratricopeptide (TPR) repeat protein